MTVPGQPKLYHIVHVDRLASIIAAGGLLCDAEVIANRTAGTTIGMNTIKQRRLQELRLATTPIYMWAIAYRFIFARAPSCCLSFAKPTTRNWTIAEDKARLSISKQQRTGHRLR